MGCSGVNDTCNLEFWIEVLTERTSQSTRNHVRIGGGPRCLSDDALRRKVLDAVLVTRFEDTGMRGDVSSFLLLYASFVLLSVNEYGSSASRRRA